VGILNREEVLMQLRIARLFFLLLLTIASAMAQQPGFSDVFPLRIGATWKYLYQYGSQCYGNMYPVGGFGTDSGTVAYVVFDSLASGDSVQWKVHTQFDLFHHSHTVLEFGVIFDTTYRINDTLSFELWETHSGNHQLFVENIYYYANPIWKFMSQSPDSQQVFRYQQTDPQGRATMNANLLGIYSTAPIPSILSFRKDSGLVSLVASSCCVCGSHSSVSLNCALLSKTLTSVDLETSVARPSGFELFQNYPNPFNPSTTIAFTLPTRAFVSVKIFDLLGRDVATVYSGQLPAGTYSRDWDASGKPSGVYFCRLQAGAFSQTTKLVLLR
jgi:hypothetical protein